MQNLPKFRGYSLRLKKWLYGDLLHYQNQLAIIPYDSDWLNVIGKLKLLNIDYVVDKESVGQCIGFKDKHKKDIFSDDILKTENGICSVIWRDLGFALLSPGSEAIDWEYSLVYQKSEIIGNKFENSTFLNPNN